MEWAADSIARSANSEALMAELPAKVNAQANPGTVMMPAPLACTNRGPMRTAVEISLYPLDAEYVPAIKDFIARLNTHADLTVTTNAMSTQIAGEHQRIFEVLARETEASFQQLGRKVFVMKVLGGTPRG